jgi:hypothetical protein
VSLAQETVAGIQIIRTNKPGGFSVRVTLYAKAKVRLADRAIVSIQREMRRHFHLIDRCPHQQPFGVAPVEMRADPETRHESRSGPVVLFLGKGVAACTACGRPMAIALHETWEGSPDLSTSRCEECPIRKVRLRRRLSCSIRILTWVRKGQIRKSKIHELDARGRTPQISTSANAKTGTIEFGGGGFDCTIRNIYDKGAALEVVSPSKHFRFQIGGVLLPFGVYRGP